MSGMNRTFLFVCLALQACMFARPAHAQIAQSTHIAYVYPAGGQTGTSLEVVIGGKGLQKVDAIQIGGGGVQATFIEHIANYKRKLQEQMRYVGRQKSGNAKQLDKGKERKFGPPPEHEIYSRLEDLSMREFQQVAAKFQTKEKVQRNRELDELVVLRINIDADARPGMRELRLLTRLGGASNPLRFMVNNLPEAREYEPNDLQSPDATHMQTPFIMNGQIMPGDEDRFSFDGIEGQRLVIHVKARELIPYLADAVPGWFQAVVAVQDEKGNVVAFADDFLFYPYPALLFEVPETGIYHVSLRDSIYRGREDFVYRVAVGEIPFVTGIFPLGMQAGVDTDITAYGWNIGEARFALSAEQSGGAVRTDALRSNGTLSNYVHYEVGQLPESREKEGNDSFEAAPRLDLQSVMNGRIDEPGDVDLFRFDAHEGQTIKASIAARRLYSPVDSLLRIFDGDGNVLAWNDDMAPAGNLTDRTGVLTHTADSELEFVAPGPGAYFVQVSDTQNKGGPTYAYRLSLTEPEPDFELYVTPSAITIPGGAGGAARLHVRRVNGFAGPIDVALSRETRALELTGGRIPSGSDSVPIVLNNQRKAAGLIPLNLVATAVLNGENVTRQVIPADDITQAFITHHLVEADGLSAYVMRSPRNRPSVRLDDVSTAVLSATEPARVNLRVGKLPEMISELKFELEEAPMGVSMETKTDAGGTSLEFTSSETLEPRLEGNLVVGVYFEFTPKSKTGKGRSRKISMGALPAIPYRTQ